MSELRMPVWQFVRLMVQVEESMKAIRGRKKPPALQDLYDAWDDTWLELDQRLTDLGKNDPDAFAELMMLQDVVLTDVTPRRMKTAAAEIRKALKTMRATLKAEKDRQAKEDLSFEIEELEDLLYDIED